LYQASAGSEAIQIALRVSGADHIEDEVHAGKFGDEILLFVIDRAFGAEGFAGADLGVAAGGCENVRAEFAGELDRGGADAARAAVDEEALAGGELADLEDVGPDG